MTTYAARRLIDGTGAPMRTDAAVTIDGERITWVGDATDADGPVTDLGDVTLLPGLIDAHTHLGIIAMEPQFDDKLSAAGLAAHVFANAQAALDAGFTTVRDVGGVDGGLARAIADGLVPGPRVLPSGPVLCQSGGHGDFGSPFHPHHHEGIPGLTQLSMTVDGPDEVRRAAREVFRRGATQVKVCVSGGVVSVSDAIEDTQFSVEELRAAVEEAKARNTYVTAHAHVTAGIRNGLEAGIECFEHGTYLDEDTVSAMRAAGVALVPTLAVLPLLLENHVAMGVPDDVLPRLEGVLDSMQRSLKMAYDARIPIGSGSDIFGPGQGGFGRELSLKATVIGPMEAIVSATSTNAAIIRRPDLGALAEGMAGDLIAVAGNPLDDPALFDDAGNVTLVVQGGRVVREPA